MTLPHDWTPPYAASQVCARCGLNRTRSGSGWDYEDWEDLEMLESDSFAELENCTVDLTLRPEVRPGYRYWLHGSEWEVTHRFKNRHGDEGVRSVLVNDPQHLWGIGEDDVVEQHSLGEV